MGAPVALCPGGTNRITGELSDGFFGSSRDADEHEEGGSVARRCCPAPCWSSRTCRIWRRSSPSSTSNRSNARRRTRSTATRGAGSSSRASTSTSGSSPRSRATTTRSPCASSSVPPSSTGSPGSRRGRLRDHRSAALLPLAAAGALARRATGGAPLRWRHLRSPSSRDGGEQPRHLQARPVERGAGALPAEDRLLTRLSRSPRALRRPPPRLRRCRSSPSSSRPPRSPAWPSPDPGRPSARSRRWGRPARTLRTCP